MKFEVYQEDPKEPEEQPICLRLIPSMSRETVTVAAVNSRTGNKIPKGNLFCIGKSGAFLPADVNTDLGLPLNSRGQLLMRGG